MWAGTDALPDKGLKSLQKALRKMGYQNSVHHNQHYLPLLAGICCPTSLSSEKKKKLIA